MSSYPPPARGNALIFNPANFISETEAITLGEADERYLKLTGGAISGTLNANTIAVSSSLTSPIINSGSYLLNGSPLSLNTAPTMLIGAGDMTVVGTKLAIQNTSHTVATISDYIHFGPHRNASGLYGSFRISTFYQSTNPDTVNYMAIRPLNTAGSSVAGGGLIMTANGRFSLNQGPAALITNPFGTLEVRGSAATTYSTGYKITSTGGSTMGSGYSANITINCEKSIVCGEPMFVLSDERLKTNIEPIDLEESLKLLDVEPVSYHWKGRDGAGHTKETGIIAQRLQEAGLGSLVCNLPSRDDEHIPDGIQHAVMYERIPMHLLNLVKHLYERLDVLESKAPKRRTKK